MCDSDSHSNHLLQQLSQRAAVVCDTSDVHACAGEALRLWQCNTAPCWLCAVLPWYCSL